MTSERFADLVQTSELHMTRLDALEEIDPHEGRWLPGTEELRFTADVEDAASLIATLEKERERTYVSCWTLRLTEQEHMWKRFDADVVVTARYEDLASAVEGVAIGGVSYLETLREFVRRFGAMNTYNLAFSKRPIFRDEQEIRLVYQHVGAGSAPPAVRLPIDLRLLRPRVIARPDVVESVRQLLSEARLDDVDVDARVTDERA